MAANRRWLILVMVGLVITGCSANSAEPVEDVPEVSGLSDVADLVQSGDVMQPDQQVCLPPQPYATHHILDLRDADTGELLNLADPCVIKVDDTWYLYATEPGPGFSTWVSTDLRTWESFGNAWLPTQGTWNARGAAWAPHVHVADDGYWLYYTADQQIGVARADSPTGPFEEVFDHPLVGGGYGGIGDGVFEHRDTSMEWLDFDERSIDAFVLEAEDGSLTMYATRYNPLSTIIAMPMSDLQTVVPEKMVVIIEPDPNGWEVMITEAPWVTQVDGRFLLTYSGNGAEMPEYSLGAAIADSPLGPFTKTTQSPFLFAVPEKDFYGPGHHAIVSGFCNDLLLFYHTKVTKEHDFNRLLRLTPVAFDREEVLLPPLP